MNKRNLILSAAVSAALVSFAGVAQAGAITTPAAPVSYAVEAIVAGTDITLSPIVYTMGVARTVAQDFTIIYTLPAGILFNATPVAPLVGGAGVAVITLKRGGVGTNEVVYDIDVTTDLTTASTITLAAPVLANSNLTAVGNSLAMTVNLKDTGETAQVDNLAAISRTVAVGATAASLLVPACDSGTTTDVNFTVPLAGFLLQAGGDGADAVLRAECGASVRVNNTTSGVRNPTNAADYILAAGDVVTLTITDPTGFLGLSTGGLGYDLSDGNAIVAGEVFTVSGNTATRALAGNLASLNAIHSVLYVPTGTTPMGTARVLSIAGAIAPAVGTAASLGSNSTWWTWGSNGTVLQSPWFSTFANGYTNRFVFQNNGSSAATYTATVRAEDGNVVTNGAAITGTIPANGQLVVPANTVATFSGRTRGTVSFTINTPAGNVKGAFQQVNPVSGNVTNVPLERVYSGPQF